MNTTPSSKSEHGKTEHGKAVSARNATTHGLFARDVVLPSLGEDPEGYRQVAQELAAQIRPQNLLEHHYVEKIAAASWRLRRLHRWQAQIFEDDTLTEDERLDKLDKVLRHETHLHRQIDTSVKMLNKDVPQLYARRVRDQVLLDQRVSERECRESVRDDVDVELETRGRLRRIQKATEAALSTLSQAPLDTDTQNCQNEPVPVGALLAAPSSPGSFPTPPELGAGGRSSPAPLLNGEGTAVEAEGQSSDWEAQNCQNEPEDKLGDEREDKPGPWTAADRQAFLDSVSHLTLPAHKARGRAIALP